MTDFESFIEKFVEFDLANNVSNKVVDDKKIMFFLYEKGNFNLLKPLVQASKDKNPQDPNDSDKETLLHKAARNVFLLHYSIIRILKTKEVGHHFMKQPKMAIWRL